MTALLGITSAILGMVAAYNSDFIMAGVFIIGGMFFAYELAFGRTFEGGPL